MSKKSCIDCKYYHEGQMHYHFYNGCDCVDEDGNINEKELKKILKNK